MGVDAPQSRYKRKTKIKSSVPRAKAIAPVAAGVCGDLRGVIFGATIAPPLVSTVTVKGARAQVLKTTVAGAWHIAPRGAPVQVTEIVPLWSRPGISCSA